MLEIHAGGVSIHAPAKGRPVVWHHLLVPPKFQSTPPRRGDGCLIPPSRTGPCFNPRPREGATVHLPRSPRADCEFQSTPPRRGDARAEAVRPDGRGFNPRPREGATDRALCTATPWRSFNPRPREGATAGRNRGCPRRVRFQSTPPRRGDRPLAQIDKSMRDVSIHAPAKGRQGVPRRTSSVRSFNPRPREGATDPERSDR